MLQTLPYVLCLPAKADGHAWVEAADHIDQESVELHPPWKGIPQLAVGSLFRQTCFPQTNGAAGVSLSCQAEVSGQESKHAERTFSGSRMASDWRIRST